MYDVDGLIWRVSIKATHLDANGSILIEFRFGDDFSVFRAADNNVFQNNIDDPIDPHTTYELPIAYHDHLDEAPYAGYNNVYLCELCQTYSRDPELHRNRYHSNDLRESPNRRGLPINSRNLMYEYDNENEGE